MATVKPGVYHKYKVDRESTVLKAIVKPGDANFERLLKIMNWLNIDRELSKMGDSLVLMALIMGLSDAHLIGPARNMLEGVRAERKDEIEALKKKLLRKYDTTEALRGLLGKSE